MIFFSSDWHIGHDKDFLYRPRGFQSIEEHDEAIITNCNKIVKEDDELWLLGDLALGEEEEWDKWLSQINCKNIHFVIGNHDTDRKIAKYINEYWFEFHGYADMIKYSKRYSFYLSHYPTLTGNFDFDKRPVWNLSGHTHSQEKFYDKYAVYNVALDAHNNYPVSIEEIVTDIINYNYKYKGDFNFGK